MNRKDPEYQEFKKEFWKWFDTLPPEKKKGFWRHKEDLAETNFYFTIWSKNS